MTIAASPSYPIAGENVSLSITGATGSADATRFELTSVPDNSGLVTGMLTDAAGDPAQEFVPDVAGAYAITAYDYRRFSGVSAFAGDPVGEARDVLVATQTGTIYAADVLDLPIRGAGHEVTLRVKIVNNTIVEASVANPTTDRARYAALDTNVLTLLAGLEGQTTTAIGDSLVTMADTYATEFNAHLASLTAHSPADTANTLAAAKIGTQAGAVQFWQLASDAYYRHLTVAGDGWHGAADLVNLPIAPRATDVAGAFVQMCDLLRVYPDHIDYVNSVHLAADTANTLPAAALLTGTVQGILDYFAAEAPTAPTKENTGAVRMVAKYGFKTAET